MSSAELMVLKDGKYVPWDGTVESTGGGEVPDLSAYATIDYVDSKVPTVGTTAPANPVVGQLWVDTN